MPQRFRDLLHVTERIRREAGKIRKMRTGTPKCPQNCTLRPAKSDRPEGDYPITAGGSAGTIKKILQMNNSAAIIKLCRYSPDGDRDIF